MKAGKQTGKKYLILLFASLVAAGAASSLFFAGPSLLESTRENHNPLSPAAILPPPSDSEPAAEKPGVGNKADSLEEPAVQMPEPVVKEEILSGPAHEKQGVAQTQEQGPLTQKDLEEIYLKAQVFRDEALEIFPLHSVEIHRPESMDPGYVEENGIQIKKAYGPPPNEIWIRIQPESAREMKEIMAQTADLYRQYVNGYDQNVRVVHWVGGRAFAAATYDADGRTVDGR